MTTGLLIKLGIALAIAALIGYLYISVEHYRTQWQLEKGMKEQCQQANVVNQQTIKDLQDRLDSADETCSKRVKEKQDLINKIQRIENLGKETNAKADDTHRAVLDYLNGMCPTTGSQE